MILISRRYFFGVAIMFSIGQGYLLSSLKNGNDANPCVLENLQYEMIE